MAVKHMRVIDLEASGLAPPESVIEIGWTDLTFDTETLGCEIGLPCAKLFAPLEPLTPENIAVHHLTDAMLEGYPICMVADLEDVALSPKPDFLVAANAQFERQWLTPPVTRDAWWICTVKAAARLYPDAKSHSNQAVRYLLGLDLPEAYAMPPHRAGPDSFVTAYILAEMLKTTKVSQLVKWTEEPRFLPRCPIGKHKDQAWETIPADYLGWILRAPEMDPDIVHAARLELDRRRA